MAYAMIFVIHIFLPLCITNEIVAYVNMIDCVIFA